MISFMYAVLVLVQILYDWNRNWSKSASQFISDFSDPIRVLLIFSQNSGGCDSTIRTCTPLQYILDGGGGRGRTGAQCPMTPVGKPGRRTSLKPIHQAGKYISGPGPLRSGKGVGGKTLSLLWAFAQNPEQGFSSVFSTSRDRSSPSLFRNDEVQEAR